MHMILFVLDDPSQLDSVLDAWNEIGVSGVTIMDSTGINRRRRARQVGTMFMAGINRLMSSDQETHYTLFTIVDSVEQVEKCITTVEKIVGDLNTPNSGVLAAWPLAYVKGVPNKNHSNEER
jgi:nitrogen regulatory protein PII